MQIGFTAEKPLGYQQAAAGTFDTAKTLATAGITIPAGTTLVLIQTEAQQIRWRDDGTAPTTTVGYPLAVAGELRYTANALANLRIISTTAGAIVDFVFYGNMIT